MSTIIDHLGSLFSEFTWIKFSGFVLFVFIAIMSVWLYDQSTGYTYYERMKAKVDVSKSLSDLDLDTLSKSKLKAINRSIVNAIYLDSRSNHDNNAVFNGRNVLRLLGANWLLFLVLVSAVNDRRKGKTTNSNTISGTLFVLVVSGVCFYLLSGVFEVMHNWWAVLLWPVLLLMPISLIAYLFMKVSESKTT